MYKVKYSKDFIKAFKKIKNSGKISDNIQKKLNTAINTLADGEVLPAIYKDHKLKGKNADRRECHIKGDLVLVYRKYEDVLVLLMVDIGTHAQIFE